MQNTKPEQLELDFNTEPKKPADENSGIHISGHVKIFDPNTKEEFVNKREDG